MRRGRRHDDQVGVARELDMAHLLLVRGREEIVVDFLVGQADEGERRDEFLAAAVITTRTRAPRSRSRRTRSSDL